jgi:PIN domain nuclease of toxin-antitoxin system
VRYLLDTQILLWAAFSSSQLSKPAIELLQQHRGSLVFSVASVWEVSIKAALGRPNFKVEPEHLRTGLIGHGYAELMVSGEHAVAVRSLRPIHGDPFDRMLLAQAISEGMTLVTTDRMLAAYGEPTLKV